MNSLMAAACLALAASAGFGQPAFETASIKPAPPPTGSGLRISMADDPGRITYSNVSLKDLIEAAYKVKDYQITGPEWLARQRFDVVATMPPDTSREQIGPMLQSLLADRFKLALHRETKQLPVYALVVAKNGPILKKTEEGEHEGNVNIERGHLEIVGITMRDFADMLARFVGRPVLDRTKLEGEYDVKLDFSPDKSSPTRDEPSSIFTALTEQLGLKLEARRSPVENLVIDHVEKAPSEN